METRFNRFVEWYGYMVDRGSKDYFDISDFDKYKKYILNWDFVKLACHQENTDGVSYLWDQIKFVEGV